MGFLFLLAVLGLGLWGSSTCRMIVPKNHTFNSTSLLNNTLWDNGWWVNLVDWVQSNQLSVVMYACILMTVFLLLIILIILIYICCRHCPAVKCCRFKKCCNCKKRRQERQRRERRWQQRNFNQGLLWLYGIPIDPDRESRI